MSQICSGMPIRIARQSGCVDIVEKSYQAAEKVRQLCSRIAQRLNVRYRVRFASSLAAAALDDPFEHPVACSATTHDPVSVCVSGVLKRIFNSLLNSSRH